MRAVAYLRVSTGEQGESGAGLAAQQAAIDAWATYRRAELVAVEQDIASGKSTNGRHGLERAVAMCKRGDADALVVAKLDRLSRSLADFAKLVDDSRKQGWAIVALDVDIDMTTANGEMLAGMLAVLSQWERRIIGERTRAALAQKKAQGVQLGRPRSLPGNVRRRIVKARERGQTFAAIAAKLNADGVPTAQGGTRWHASTVRHVVTAG